MEICLILDFYQYNAMILITLCTRGVLIMSQLTQALDYIAEQLIKKEHAEISKGMTVDEKICFVNSVATLAEHSAHIQKTTLFEVV